MAQTLLEHGWTNARALRGGFDAWLKAGYPTEAKPTRRQRPQEVAANIEAAAEGNDAEE